MKGKVEHVTVLYFSGSRTPKRVRVRPDNMHKVKINGGEHVIPPDHIFYPEKKRQRPYAVVNSQDSVALDLNGAVSPLHPSSLNEVANNTYVANVLEGLKAQQQGMAARDWLVLGALGLMLLVQFYLYGELMDAVRGLAAYLQGLAGGQTTGTVQGVS